MNCDLCDKKIFGGTEKSWKSRYQTYGFLCCLECFNSLGNIKGVFTLPKKKEFLIKRFGSRCMEESCSNKDNLEIHHIKPLVEGGRNKIYNLIILCNKCHKLKHKNHPLKK